MFAIAIALALTPALKDAGPLVPYEIKTDEDFVRALREHYTKNERAIPMRDGVKLHTDIYAPKDATRAWPILFVRTPYSLAPYGPENVPDAKNARALRRFIPSKELLRSGYIIVHQDVRGRLMSEGTFVDVRPLITPDQRKKKQGIDESTDAYDTVDWLVKNWPNNNGRVGVWGISYPGFYAAQAAVDAHPAVKAVSPEAPVTDWFVGDDFHHNGALCLADAFDFYANFGRERPKPTKKIAWDFEHEIADVYDFFLKLGPLKNANTKYLEGKIAFWNDLMAHPNRDAWWTARDPRPQYRDIKPAALVVGGWYDAEDLWGALHTYEAMETQTKANRVSLVMGPWAHGGWHRSDGDKLGDISFGQKASERFRDEIEFPFWESHLKGDGNVKTPEAFMFVTGENAWRAFPTWPPKSTSSTLYLGNGTLSSTRGAEGSDSWIADPHKPVPYMDGASAELDHEYMTADQRFASRRPDVLTFDSGVLSNDVTIAGPVTANIYVSTTGTDMDVVVKLIDVWPEDTNDPDPNPKGIRLGGYQQLVRAEVMRGKFRNSYEKPEPFKPGEPTLVKVPLPDLAHTFRAGHRMMVQVQASWFPMVDSNPQTFVDINTADESAFKTQTHTLLRTAKHPSSIVLPVIAGKAP
jgi:uncharacterized protein